MTGAIELKMKTQVTTAIFVKKYSIVHDSSVGSINPSVHSLLRPYGGPADDTVGIRSALKPN